MNHSHGCPALKGGICNCWLSRPSPSASAPGTRAADLERRCWEIDRKLSAPSAAPLDPPQPYPPTPLHIQFVRASPELVDGIVQEFIDNAGPVEWVIYFESPSGGRAQTFATLRPYPGSRAAPVLPDATPTLTMIVNGTERRIPFTKGETVGVLAHRALAADGYGWTQYELRDEAGSLLMERTPAIAGETVYIAKPIGWGG